MNDFWSANFWGILGTGIASFSLLVSYLSFSYSRPQIRVTDAQLRTRRFDKEFLEKNKGADTRFFQNHSVGFVLKIRLTNKKGGAGAISKPLVIIRVGPKFWLKKREEIVLEPNTKSYSHTQTSPSSYTTETIDLGGSFNLTGGQIIHDELEYHAYDEEMWKLAREIDNAEYFIRYNRNSGKEVTCPVVLVLTEH